jgi:signal transduction histidine kinase
MLAVLVLLLRRAIVESRLARRIAWPMLVAGIAVAAGVVVEFGTVVLATSSPDRFDAWALANTVNAATGAGVAIALLVGLVRGRLARQSVADLVLELGDPAGRTALRDVVARALRDPSAELLYPGEGGRYHDATGAERSVPPPAGGDRATTRIGADGKVLAVLVHDPAIAEQPELLRSVIAAIRLALENERLAAEVRAQLAEVQASRARIVAAGDEQRRRIERDLHDGAQQRLVTLALRLEAARESASPGGPGASADPELSAALAAASRDLAAAIAELRDLARGLHPAALATDGVLAAIEALCDRTPIPVDVHVTEDRFPEVVETAAYFVVAEALTNVVRYASATRASVTIAQVDRQLVVQVTDDGDGGADPSRGTGLRGLEDRLAAVGGRLTVISPPGKGTTVRAELPCG